MTIRCGRPPSAVTQTYPNDSIQSLLSPQPWWIDGPLQRGSLVWAPVPYPDQKPYRLVVVDRGQDARQHEQATYRMEEFNRRAPRSASSLPVAAVPSRPNEDRIVRRGKWRPCLVLAGTDVPVDSALAPRGRWQTRLARLLVPYYSANGSTSRSGWPERLVDRIRRCGYPQYFWDRLPLDGSSEGSILRLDNAFTIGHDLTHVEQTQHRLSQDALDILHDWFAWYVTGRLGSDSIISTAQDLFADL